MKEGNSWFLCDDKSVTKVHSVEVRYSIIIIVVMDKKIVLVCYCRRQMRMCCSTTEFDYFFSHE